MKSYFIVDKDYSNTRLDRWFKKKICKIPQSLIEKQIRLGNIKVNHNKVKSSYKLQPKDEILIINFNPVSKVKEKIKNKYSASKKEIVSASSNIIEDNENFLIINKPAGISVQSGTKSNKNVIDILRKTNSFEGKSPYIVHRIDKDTTGLLIISKNREYAQFFTSLFRIRKIHKSYLAIVLGKVKIDKGTLVDNLTYFENKKKTTLKAITHYTVLNKNDDYSLLLLKPETGRKHQLRKQLLMHKHPILGDSKYNFIYSKINKKSNLMLHSYKVKFLIKGEKFNYLAEPSMIFKKTLKEKYLKMI